MLICGPLGLNWRSRKWGILPRLENAEISAINPPTPDRVKLWVARQIHVIGRSEWVFVKVHCHGCAGENMGALLGGEMRRLHETLKADYNDGRAWCLHYVTAREMYNVVRAAEDGHSGSPGQFRDYEVGAP